MDSQRYFQVGVNCEHPSFGPLSPPGEGWAGGVPMRVAFDLGSKKNGDPEVAVLYRA